MLKFTLYPAVPFRASRVRSATADEVPLTGTRHFVKWCLLCVLVFCSGSVFAQSNDGFSCSSNSGGNYAPDIGTVRIATDAAIGFVASTKVPGTPYSGFCKETSGVRDREATVVFSVDGQPIEGYTDVYPTNLDGLGVRYTISRREGGTDCGAPEEQRIVQTYTTKCWVRTGTTKTWSWVVYVDFIKIKNRVVSGALTRIPVVNMAYAKNGNAAVDGGVDWTTRTSLTSMYTGVATGTVTLPTCTTPDVTIPMGNANFATFNGTGTVNDRWNNTTFNANNCPAGLTQVSIKFNTPLAGWLDETNGVFKLNNPTSSTTAKGIGIQMSFGANNTPVVYNTAQPLSGYDAIKTTGGSFTVPIGARYVKPASTTRLVAGQANGAVVFVMSYE